MAKKLKDIFSKARKVAGTPGRVVAGAYYDSKVRMNTKKNDQLVDDIKTVREMSKRGVERGSMQDPLSRGRRQERINNFKDEMALTGLPKGSKVIMAEDSVPKGKYTVQRNGERLVAIPKKRKLFGRK